MTPPGIQLSLLEGMDEDLLLRLHGAGITTREALESALTTPSARRQLAERLQVPNHRIEALHHLNFVLPEEQAARLFRLERSMGDRMAELERRRSPGGLLLWILAGVALLAALAALGAALFLDRGDPAREAALATRVDGLEERVEALLPLARGRAEAELLDELGRLGPAPGWTDGPRWTPERDRSLALALPGDGSAAPTRAVSLALTLLTDLEEPDGRTPAERANEAVAVLADFPDPGAPTDVWSAAALTLRTRLLGRALGLAPLESVDPEDFTRLPWPWTDPSFAVCEVLVARLESLPLQEDALPVWSETLVALRAAADRGQDTLDRAGASEAWARNYWIRRGELELAVVGALLRRDTLLPYHADSPRAFLATRAGFLDAVILRAPGRAREALLWQRAEYREAELLLDWLAADPGRAPGVAGRSWLRALAEVESERGRDGSLDAGAVRAAIATALGLSPEDPEGIDPFSLEATRREAGLRPLLMTVRSATPPPPAGTPGS